MKLTKNPITKVLAVTMLAFGGYSSGVMAQSTPAVVCPDHETPSSKVPSQRVGRKIQDAFEAYSNDLVDEAISILLDIDTSDEFDRAYTDRFVGNLLAAKEGEAKRALTYLEGAAKKKLLNDTEHAATLKLVADLNLQEQNYATAVEWYKKWQDFTCKEDPDVYVRMAQAYYELKQLDKIIEPANKAIALYDKPNKNPYVLKMTSYYERKMYPQTIEVAEELVRMFPDTPQWWTQLGFFYMLVEDYKKALSTFEMALNQGYLKKKSEINALAQLYATNEIPYKSAVLQVKYLKEGLLERDAGRLASIANVWHQAKEIRKAADYYGQAAALSNDADHFRRQGTLLLAAEQYSQAISALQKAVELTPEDESGNLYMAIMEAYFYQGKFKDAHKYVQLAKKDKNTARSARSWEPYIKDKAKNRGINI
ncbi:tetratricopeptide repeat protein [Lacimicrobium alkaliphilum]